MRGWRRAGIAWIVVLGLTAGCQEGDEESALDPDDPAVGMEADTAAVPFEEAHERQRVVVQAASFAYQPNEIRVAPGPVTFVVTNAADIEHGFEVEGHGLEVAIESIAPGTTDSLTVSFEQSGEYVVYCPVGDHQGRGMTGTVMVGG